MDPRLEAPRRALVLNTRLVRNCLDGVDDAQARRRPNAHTNNIAFLAMHLVDVRFYLARYLGGSADSPFKALLDPIRSIDALHDYPTVDAILAAWETTEARVLERVAATSSAEWDVVCEPKFPIGDATRLDGVTFLVEHESYHIGQMALLRRFLGLPAMRYA